MAIIGLVGLKCAPECIKMHHFEGENAKIFPSQDPTPIDAFGASIRVPSALDPQTTFLDTGLVLPPLPLQKFLRVPMPPAGSGAEPQPPKSNLVHFSLKIWHLVATI